MTTALRRTHLWERVSITPTCWLWTGTLATNGYGIMWTGEKTRVAHRLVFELLIGDVPEGLELDHLCRVRHCVRPDHLEPVTHAENMLRARRSHCKRGHERTAVNIRITKRGSRQCIPCHREDAKAQYLRGRAA
jgi:hypothetical protein